MQKYFKCLLIEGFHEFLDASVEEFLPFSAAAGKDVDEAEGFFKVRDIYGEFVISVFLDIPPIPIDIIVVVVFKIHMILP